MKLIRGSTSLGNSDLSDVMSSTIHLHHTQIKKLKAFCRGSTPAREVIRARVLLLLHDGHGVDKTSTLVPCSTSTVKRVRRRFLDGGFARALHDAPRPGRAAAVTTKEERELIAEACSAPPEGSPRWTIRLLAKHSGHSFHTVHRVLKEDGIKPWREKNVVRPRNHSRVSRADG